MNYSFVTACGIALRFRDRETQTTVRAESEKLVWAFLVTSFISALCVMKGAPIALTVISGAATLALTIILCFIK
jgi:hypothetical protein